RLVEGFSELAHSLLLLPRQFYGATLPCFGLYPLEKTGIARCMPDILLVGDKYFSSGDGLLLDARPVLL
ncbi:hypothetical protein, partial [Desulfovibrio sp.]|uniref:hypothetical protein n=1 Tax=Desulfovibrio sp. TaxID=885 RepID=UPI003AF9A85C